VEGVKHGGRKMNRDVQAMLNEIRGHKESIRNLTDELARMVMQIPGIKEGIESGLVKLNFTAPAGFYRVLQNHK
jgi:hypothetical protein